MTVTDDIFIKQVKSDDLDKIVAFRELFSEPDAPVRHLNDKYYYSWHTFENPVKGGSFWAAYHKDKVIGMYSFVPKRILVNSHEYTICERCNAFVHPDFQGQKIWSRLHQHNRKNIQQNGINLEYSLPTTALSSIHIKKTQSFPLENFKLNNLVLPLNLQSIIKLKFSSGRISKIIPNLMKLPFNFFSKLYGRNKNTAGFLIHKEDSLPHEYSEFWKKSQNLYQLYFVRDPEYIQWRYFSVPETFEFFSIRENDSMIGYYVIKKIPWQDLQIGNIVDFFFSKDDKWLFRAMLISAIQELMKRNVALIQTWCLKPSPYFKQFIKFGFLPFRKINLLFSNQAPFTALENGKVKAHITMGDSDLI